MIKGFLTIGKLYEHYRTLMAAKGHIPDLEEIKLRGLTEIGDYLSHSRFATDVTDRGVAFSSLVVLAVTYLTYDILRMDEGKLERNTQYGLEEYMQYMWPSMERAAPEDRRTLTTILDSLTCFSSLGYEEKVGVEADFEIWSGDAPQDEGKVVISAIPMWLHNIFELLVPLESYDPEQFVELLVGEIAHELEALGVGA